VKLLVFSITVALLPLWIVAAALTNLAAAWRRLLVVAVRERPLKVTQYWRQGQCYMPQAGSKVYLRYKLGFRGEMPRHKLTILTRDLSWRFARTTWAARAVILCMLVLVFCCTSVTAMQARNAQGTQWDVPLPQDILISMPPCPAIHLVAAGLMQYDGMCFRWGWL
jgi:hypothetical protein